MIDQSLDAGEGAGASCRPSSNTRVSCSVAPAKPGASRTCSLGTGSSLVGNGASQWQSWKRRLYVVVNEAAS